MSWLEETTNRDEAYWVARVQRLIADSTVPREDGHGETDLGWIRTLVDEVEQTLPPGNDYDGNMEMAARLSAILGLWFAQVQYAKCQDPNRPIFVRQKAYQRLLSWTADFMLNCIDHSGLQTFFPGQKQSDPFNPTERGGEFL